MLKNQYLHGVPNEIQQTGNLLELMRLLQEAVYREGGDDYSLHRLHREPDLVTAVARLVVGDIWKHVEHPFALEVDFDVHLGEFNKAIWDKGPPICNNLFRGGYAAGGDPHFTDSRPRGPCRYKLVHYSDVVTAEKVREDYDPAGYRELCVFRSIPLPEGHYIVALGVTFPTEQDTCVLGMGFRRATDRMNGGPFGPDCFFLVRLYE